MWLHFVNTSLESGQVPYELKVSTVTPIEKRTNISSEFRPINILPSAERVLETVVYEQFSKS